MYGFPGGRFGCAGPGSMENVVFMYSLVFVLTRILIHICVSMDVNTRTYTSHACLSTWCVFRSMPSVHIFALRVCAFVFHSIVACLCMYVMSCLTNKTKQYRSGYVNSELVERFHRRSDGDPSASNAQPQKSIEPRFA